VLDKATAGEHGCSGAPDAAAKFPLRAAGRGSSVARQIGAAAESDRLRHLMSGLLVENAHRWSADLQLSGEGDRTFFVFPQGDGRIRLYLCYMPADRRRFAGPEATARFLEGVDRCDPHDDASCLPDPSRRRSGACQSNLPHFPP
jgi:menaquinone-9 beta-reductase